MKRSILILVLIFGMLLSACSAPAAPTQEPPKSAPVQPTQPQVQPPTAPAGPTIAPVPATQAPQSPAVAGKEITFTAWGAPEELAVWQQIVNEFQAANPDTKVNVEVSDWDSYWTKLNAQLAGDILPDVFAMDPPYYNDWQSRGALLNLQPYIDANKSMLDGMFPVTLEVYKLPDGYYGLPRDFQTIVLFYNKDMFDKAKMAYPTADWTMDDLRAAAKKLTLDTNGDGKVDQYGFATDVWDMELFWSEAIWSWGGEIINPEHSKTLLGESKARDAWHFIADMMLKDKSMPDPNTSTQYGGDPFQAGVAAMTTIGHWAVPGFATVSFKWDVAPMPKGPAGRATSVNSAGFVVAKHSKNPDAAFKFIQYCISKQGQTRLAELGLAVPVLKDVALSDAFLKNKLVNINQQVFLDSLQFARTKPSFRGYEAWSSAVGDGMTPAWNGEAEFDPTLDGVVTAADAVLAENQSK